MNTKLKGCIFILGANICFAFNTSISRIIIPNHMSPFGLSELRILFAAISFTLLALFIKNDALKFTIKDHLRLLACGILGTALNQLSFLGGLALSSPVDASLISTCTPIITMIFASFIIKEPISLKKALGVIIGMSGAILIIYTTINPGDTAQTGTLRGDLLIGLSSVVYALYLVLVKPIMKTHNSIHVIKWIFVYGAITTFPFLFNQMHFIGPLNSNGLPPTDILLYLLFALIIGTFIPYLFVAFSLKLLRPTTVSMFNYIQPIITSTLAISIGQDIFTWSKPIAALLIFIGVYLVINSKANPQNSIS